jgi:DNA polymerase
MDDLRRGLVAYLRQQAERGMPDIIFTRGFLASLRERLRAPSPSPTALPEEPAPVSRPQGSGGSRRGRPRPIKDLHRLVASPPHVTDTAYEARREALKVLFYDSRDCRRCHLAESRNRLVFGAGNAAARVVVVGEAPGAEEDARGMPFVGRAGQLLTEMLTAIGLDRTRDVFITNILKCRPPGNRTPEESEVEACIPLLRRQIEAIHPEALLLMGRTAAAGVLGRAESIGSLRGQKLSYGEIPAVVTYHPAALLRNESYKRPAWEDLKRLAATLEKRHAEGGTES